MANSVVAHIADGTLVKGTTLNVELSKPSFHVKNPEGRMVEVKLASLKALFFVKDLAGNPQYREQERPNAGDPRLHGSQLIELRFRDGERLLGLTNRYPPVGAFFYVLPVDPKSNNIRILVNRAEVASISQPAASA
jgi:hypothetical protein